MSPFVRGQFKIASLLELWVSTFTDFRQLQCQ
jgi:hypothetical protein